MKCGLCNLKVDRHELKIQCFNCKEYYHAKCAKLEKREIEFFERNGQGYKCGSCVTQRRKSILTDAPINPSADIVSSKSTASTRTPTNSGSGFGNGNIIASTSTAIKSPAAPIYSLASHDVNNTRVIKQ